MVLYLVQESIKGWTPTLKERNYRLLSSRGIKALDDYTFSTLNKPEPASGILRQRWKFWLPKWRVLELKGDDFAKGTTPSSILYNGPFLLKSIVAKSSVEFAENPNYGIRTMSISIRLNYHSGVTRYQQTNWSFKDGSFSMSRLFPSATFTERDWKGI